MKNRGQFFLIAAAVIAFLIAGITATYISINVQKDDSHLDDLSEEINLEASNLIDYSILNSNDYRQDLLNLTSTYFKNNPNLDIIIIYGNQTNITQTIFNRTKFDSLPSYFSESNFNGLKIYTYNTNPSPDYKTSINIKNINYEFDILNGENFFVILREKKEGDEIVKAR